MLNLNKGEEKEMMQLLAVLCSRVQKLEIPAYCLLPLLQEQLALQKKLKE